MTGPTDEQLEGIRQASDLILKAGYLVAFVGAGMSVESGIPPFRGPGGQWTRHGEPTGWTITSSPRTRQAGGNAV